MSEQETEYPNFHGIDVEPAAPDSAMFHIIPVPHERSTSYGHGTARGPSAILKASSQLELYDGVSVPAEKGIYTHPPVACDGQTENVLERIGAAVTSAVEQGGLPVLLGGEHTITYGALKALKERGQDFGVVQFDAHADLRNTYEGSSFSHACVMHRVLDMDIPVFQIGVRALSTEEVALREQQGIPHLDAVEIARTGFPEIILPDDFPKNIYLTFDIDALDPSIMPATGTPEPGGLGWYEAMTALEQIVGSRNVIGFDTVELAPIAGYHAYDFTAARLVYNLMGFIARTSEPR